MTTWLSLNQVICGLGSPAALQLRVTGSFFLMRTEFGCSMMRGGEKTEEEEEEEEEGAVAEDVDEESEMIQKKNGGGVEKLTFEL